MLLSLEIIEEEISRSLNLVSWKLLSEYRENLFTVLYRETPEESRLDIYAILSLPPFAAHSTLESMHEEGSIARRDEIDIERRSDSFPTTFEAFDSVAQVQESKTVIDESDLVRTSTPYLRMSGQELSYDCGPASSSSTREDGSHGPSHCGTLEKRYESIASTFFEIPGS